MIDNIKGILDNNNSITDYILREEKTASEELFLIQNKVDMSRSKDVRYYIVTIFKDFEENGEKFKGSSEVKLHPSMNLQEMERKIHDAVFAAGFAKNNYYPLPSIKETPPVKEFNSKFKDGNMKSWVKKIYDTLYASDVDGENGINSSEIFLNKENIRVITSKGFDSSYEKFKGSVEVITSWKGEQEEVEIFKTFGFSDFDDGMGSIIKNQISSAREKSQAAPTPHLGKADVIICSEDVRKLLDLYVKKSWSAIVHRNMSNWKLEECIQGEDVIGDKISMELDPFMEHSIESVPFDKYGTPLRKINVIEDGILKTYHGDIQDSFYLGVEPTGNIKNFRVAPGVLSEIDLKKDPYLEVKAFSSFNVDFITGNFGGEIRLARYFDGDMIHLVTGGSITGNLMEAQRTMRLSKETQKISGFHGPKMIKLFNLNVAGV